MKTNRKRKTAQPGTEEGWEFTAHITILGKGKSELGERFVKLGIQGEDGYVEEFIRTDNLTATSETISALNRVGAGLVSRAAREEFIKRIQALGVTPTTIRVATRIGYHGPPYVLPDEVISAGDTDLGVCLDPSSVPYASKFRTSDEKDCTEIPELARGNSRLMACLSLGFVGPCVNIMDLEQIGLQLAGAPGSGKSSIAIAVGSLWGRQIDPNRAREHGFCETWNNTVLKFEPMALGHNHALLIADETRTADSGKKPVGAVVNDVAIRLEKAAERGRQPDLMAARSWWVPFLSTSNKTLDELCTEAGIELDDAIRGRLIDLGPPEDGDGFFEDLHGYQDVVAFSVRLRELAGICFGWPSRRFIRKLVRWHARDPKGLRAWFEERRNYYLERAKKITAPGRLLDRIHEKFATLYAVGCLAIKFGIFPWARKELRDALLKCERDHVTLVADQLGVSVPAVRGPFDRLLTYIRTYQHRFVDLTMAAAGEPLVVDQDPNLGYRNDHKGKPEFLFTEDVFDHVAGGKKPSVDLKQDLDRRGLIGSTAAGKQRKKYVVRRRLLSESRKQAERQWVVAVDARILDANP